MRDEIKNIKNEETETSNKTGEDIFPLSKEEPTHTFTKNDSNEEPTTSLRSEQIDYSLNPAEISRKKYYDSEKRKNDAKTAVFNVLKYLIPIFFSLVVGLLAIFGSIWAYKLNNIAEPIGGIKVEIENLKSNNNLFRTDIEKLEDRVNGYLEKNMK